MSPMDAAADQYKFFLRSDRKTVDVIPLSSAGGADIAPIRLVLWSSLRLDFVLLVEEKPGDGKVFERKFLLLILKAQLFRC
mmetsp:Transcript_85943/g.139355  ORF Transcript_85943/g.139355 Transcript_85943/m.139355 type:complete len:81 (-) Transcript_85943:613-855(-)